MKATASVGRGKQRLSHLTVVGVALFGPDKFMTG